MKFPVDKLLPALAAALLAACGGDGGDGGDAADRGAALPAPVVQQVSARDGGQLQMDGADGSRVTLDVAPGSFDADRAVTLRALPPADGAPLRIEIAPAVEAFRVPPTLRVVPPAFARSGAPALRAGGGEWLATRLLPDGALEATLRAATPALRRTAASRQRVQGARPQAVEPVSPYQLSPFLANCEQPNEALTAARAIFDHDTNPEHVMAALALVANLSNVCGGVPAAGEALDTLRDHVAVEYPNAVALWRQVDYRDLARLPDFRGGLTRLLAWCGAAQLLGVALDCPPADAAVEFGELLSGFEQALPATEDLTLLQRRAGELLQAASDAQTLGVSAAVEGRLLDAAGRAGRRIVERAWALCSRPDMARWMGALATLPNSLPDDLIAEGLLYCGSRLAVQGRDAAGARLPDLQVELQPGDVEGAGAMTSTQLTLPTDGRVAMRYTGPAMRCTRVVGAAEGRDEIVWRAGGVELARRAHDGTQFDGPEVELALPALRALLGQAADARERIAIEIWHVNAAITCDVDGEPMHIDAADQKLYTVMLAPPPLGVTVSPAEARVPMFGRVSFAAVVSGADDASIDWSASGGRITPDGSFIAPAVPGTYTVTATSRARPDWQASARVTVAMPTSAGLWMGSASAEVSASSGSSGRLNNLQQQRRLISTDSGQIDTTTAFQLGGFVASTAPPVVDAAGNLVLRWQSTLPGSAGTLAYERSGSSTTTTPCGPQYQTTVTLTGTQAFSGAPLDRVQVDVQLTITPAGKATLTGIVYGQGMAQGSSTGRYCEDDPWLDLGRIVDLTPITALAAGGGASGPYAFDLMQAGTASTAVTRDSVPGTRTLAWDGLSLQETLELSRDWHQVDAEFGTDKAYSTRVRTVNRWVVELR